MLRTSITVKRRREGVTELNGTPDSSTLRGETENIFVECPDAGRGRSKEVAALPWSSKAISHVHFYGI